uniref:PH and SEC7 domain-containing protein 2-like n=1 Tax=Paramormyrops kingsleyae TaxID=1676925 RepID=A0A3B3QDD7_9TELE|nr:PH and SEC7 domain-containing protein 2-like [Paramormyrops kingsleyae]
MWRKEYDAHFEYLLHLLDSSRSGVSPDTASDSHSELGSSGQLEQSGRDVVVKGGSADRDAAKHLAGRLFRLEGFRRRDVAQHLSKNNKFNQMVAAEYLNFFNFTGLTLEQALRTFLKTFPLTGETQERERILAHFSRRFSSCNPVSHVSEDGIHALTCALMLLNTDLHGHNLGRKMTCQQFIRNLDGLNGGGNFPKDLLKASYHSIRNEKLDWAPEEEKPLSGTEDRGGAAVKPSESRNPVISGPLSPGRTTHKHGTLLRKVLFEMDGRPAPRVRRSWKKFSVVLRGAVLYLQKTHAALSPPGGEDEYNPDKEPSEVNLKDRLSVHHALASRASDYGKRPNVFKLKTSDWKVFLFQAPSEEEMVSWIRQINLVAALSSAPALPAPVGSRRKFCRPFLPSSTTRLSQEEQLKSHENKLKQICSELESHTRTPTDATGWEERLAMEQYLTFERERYGAYVSLLRAELEGGDPGRRQESPPREGSIPPGPPSRTTASRRS